jgi:hypothetical protein
MRKEIGATRDEVLWEMPLPELNLMLHAYYHMEGRDTRKPTSTKDNESRFRRIKLLLGMTRQNQ